MDDWFDLRPRFAHAHHGRLVRANVAHTADVLLERVRRVGQQLDHRGTNDRRPPGKCSPLML